jgi:hypothetical protein
MPSLRFLRSPVLVARLVLPASLAAIFVLTLTPASGHPTVSGTDLCLICGEVGAATGLLNLLLFVPFGWALGQVSASRWRPVLLGLALSLAVELVQRWIPGRDVALGDVAFNAAGAFVGAGVAGWWRHLLAREERRPGWLGLLAGMVGAGVLLSTALLFTPSLPGGVYFGQWTPDLAQFQRYDGSVTSATLGGQALRDGRLRDSGRVRSLLAEGAALEVHVRAGSPPPGLAPVFSLFNGRQEEVLVFGFDGADLVFRPRTRAVDLRFLPPEARWPGAARGLTRGRPVVLRAWQAAHGVCLALDSRSSCGLGPTVGSAWMLFWMGDLPGASTRRALDALCLALLFLPLGLAARRRWRWYLGLALAGSALAAAPALSPLLAALSAGNVLACAAGLAGGFALRARHGPPSATSSPRPAGKDRSLPDPEGEQIGVGSR